MRNPKKPKGDVETYEDDAVVCNMEADDINMSSSLKLVMAPVMGHDVPSDGVKGMCQSVGKESVRASTTVGYRANSYARVVASKSVNGGWFVDDRSFNTEDGVVLDEDCLVNEDGDYSTKELALPCNDNTSLYGPWMVANPQRRMGKGRIAAGKAD
ncbi:hypothetical protein V6N11_009402 [Hibiscus sabdariffa]|uniref:Uncharacterized protein n=1 Tax=Hibiscus sabdariffa TaxID=183260 RepID=A0ABR2NSV3_9ROSI